MIFTKGAIDLFDFNIIQGVALYVISIEVLATAFSQLDISAF
ncbi:hypothetical protein ALTERO38_51550 [Alteromonas sp. 38]|nr:hypothetical protein ALTER154_80094 [Alteromonas sp. 154]VXB77836.1 hypothetical protein ALTERO38_51550 [Alteromonas sp. 38]